LLALALAVVGLAAMARTKALATEPVLDCPTVMAHTVDKTKHPGWSIYSNMPVRLTGADIAYVVDRHYEATLEPDQTDYWNDDNLSTAQVFQLTKHKGANDLSLVCHYGVHAQLSKAIPAKTRVCTIVHRRRFDETKEGEYSAYCE
jgi:hypothetical protein